LVIASLFLSVPISHSARHSLKGSPEHGQYDLAEFDRIIGKTIGQQAVAQLHPVSRSKLPNIVKVPGRKSGASWAIAQQVVAQLPHEFLRSRTLGAQTAQ
jgi:hypothetical protein